MRSSTGSSKMSSSRAKSASSGRKVASGRLELDFAADANGLTYLRHQYADYPFHVCRLQYQDTALPGLATLYIQSSSGGVYEDDLLDVSIAADAAAQAHVTTQAATIVHSMPSGQAEQRVTIDCKQKSYLEYLPDPQILFPGSAFISRIVVRLEENATALISDGFLQHDPGGTGNGHVDYGSEIVIEDAGGEVLAIDRLRIHGNILGQHIPGVTGAFAAQSTFVVAGRNDSYDALLSALRGIHFDSREAVIGSTLLPNSAGLLVRLLAADGVALRRSQHLVWHSIRAVLKGHPPAERRK